MKFLVSCLLIIGSISPACLADDARPEAFTAGGKAVQKTARYAVIDLGADYQPIRVANNGWVLLSKYNSDDEANDYFRWKSGTLEQLTCEAGNLFAVDMNNSGAVVASGVPYFGEIGETSCGIVWPADSAEGRVMHSPITGQTSQLSILYGFYYFTDAKSLILTAISDNGSVYGKEITDGVFYSGYPSLWSLPQSVKNAVKSNASSVGAPFPISHSHAFESTEEGHDEDGATLIDYFWPWAEESDYVTQAKDNHYIGSCWKPGTPYRAQVDHTYQFSTHDYAWGGVKGDVIPADSFGMIDGASVPFFPYLINKAGDVVGEQAVPYTIFDPRRGPYTAYYNCGFMCLFPNAGGSPSGSGNRIGTGWAVALNDHTTSGTDGDGNPTQTPSPQILGYLGSEPTLWETSDKYNGFVPNALSEMIPDNNAWHLTSVAHLNDSGSIVGYGGYLDPSNPHATRDGHAFLLLPVDITKLWSDQLTGVTDANFLPNQTGGQERQYMLMGAAQSFNYDGKGHLKAKVTVPGPAELRNKILWRLAKRNGNSYEPENGTSTYNANGDEVTITVDNPRTDDAASSYLVAGYDQDGNGQLSSLEASIVPKYKWHHGGVTEDHEYEVKIIAQSTYDSNKGTLSTLATTWSWTGLTQAGRVLTAFLTESTPVGATAQATTIAKNDFRLTHAVGVLFKPPGNPGDSINAVFTPNSEMTQAVLDSNLLYYWLAGQFQAKRQEVDQRFRNSTNLVETFNWHFDGGDFNFTRSADIDLFFALGDTLIGGVDVEVEVHKFLYTVESVKVTGTVTDLTDFDYDGPPRWPEFVRDAARVQSGYNTLGTAGRIYTIGIQMLDSHCSRLEGNFEFQ